VHHRHTLLALAGTYGLLGAPDGKTITPAANWAVNSLRDFLNLPVRIEAPPLNAVRSGEYRLTVRPELPPEAVIKFEYHTEPLTGITVYTAFYKGIWYIRELRGATGLGTGDYFRVERGGAEWLAKQSPEKLRELI
jgi:hypothetical protein